MTQLKHRLQCCSLHYPTVRTSIPTLSTVEHRTRRTCKIAPSTKQG